MNYKSKLMEAYFSSEKFKTKIKDKTKKLRLQGSQHKQAPSPLKHVSELEPVKT